jgi:hypothetical protein
MKAQIKSHEVENLDTGCMSAYRTKNCRISNENANLNIFGAVGT